LSPPLPLVWTDAGEPPEEFNRAGYITQGGNNFFTRDLIAGAVRLSVVDDVPTPTAADRKLLWLPNPHLFLERHTGTYTSFTVHTDAQPGQEQFTFDTVDTFTHRYWDTPAKSAVPSPAPVPPGPQYRNIGFADGLVAGRTGIYNPPGTMIARGLDQAGPIAQIPGPVNGGWYYSGAVNVNIWVEGCDNESQRALARGKFNVDLVFTAK